jgi:hypothetical protein
MEKGGTVEKAKSRRRGASSRAALVCQDLSVEREAEFRERRQLTEGEDCPAGGKEGSPSEAFSCQGGRMSARGCAPRASRSG